MLVDSYLEMADNTAVPTTGTLTNPLVIGEAINVRPMVDDNPTADISGGEPLYLVIEITDDFAGDLTSYSFRAYTHHDSIAHGSSASAATWVICNCYMPKADLVAGTRLIFSVSYKAGYKQYLMVTGNASSTGVNVITAGSVSAYLTKDVANWTPTNTRTG